MYTLVDTFNDRVISRHRTLDALARAQRRFDRAVRRQHGPDSYIPTDALDGEGRSISRTPRHPEREALITAQGRAEGLC